MPSISTVTTNSRPDLLPEKRELLREPYLDMVKAMVEDKQPRTLSPGEGETLRKIRVNVTRAANELEVKLTQRETRDGSLYVYLKPELKNKARNSANGSAPSPTGQTAVATMVEGEEPDGDENEENEEEE